MFDPLRKSDPDVFEFPWLKFLVPSWEPGEMYTVGDVVRPRAANGFFAQCTIGNESAAREPAWVRESGIVVDDGSVVWLMVAPSEVSLPSITSATYTIDPAGITQSLATIDGTKTTVKLDASGADVGTYRVVAEIVADGEDHSQEESLEVFE